MKYEKGTKKISVKKYADGESFVDAFNRERAAGNKFFRWNNTDYNTFHPEELAAYRSTDKRNAGIRKEYIDWAKDRIPNEGALPSLKDPYNKNVDIYNELQNRIYGRNNGSVSNLVPSSNISPPFNAGKPSTSISNSPINTVEPNDVENAYKLLRSAAENPDIYKREQDINNARTVIQQFVQANKAFFTKILQTVGNDTTKALKILITEMKVPDKPYAAASDSSTTPTNKDVAKANEVVNDTSGIYTNEDKAMAKEIIAASSPVRKEDGANYIHTYASGSAMVAPSNNINTYPGSYGVIPAVSAIGSAALGAVAGAGFMSAPLATGLGVAGAAAGTGLEFGIKAAQMNKAKKNWARYQNSESVISDRNNRINTLNQVTPVELSSQNPFYSYQPNQMRPNYQTRLMGGGATDGTNYDDNTIGNAMSAISAVGTSAASAAMSAQQSTMANGMGGIRNTKIGEIEDGELRLMPTPRGFQLIEDVDGDRHSEGGEMRELQEGEMIVPRRDRRVVLDMLRKGDHGGIEQYRRSLPNDSPMMQNGGNGDPIRDRSMIRMEQRMMQTPEGHRGMNPYITNPNIDYDYMGYFMNGGENLGGHYPDTYKLPNHPTFSNESMYNGQGGKYGGYWEGERFNPTELNIQNGYRPEEYAGGSSGVGGDDPNDFWKRYAQGPEAFGVPAPSNLLVEGKTYSDPTSAITLGPSYRVARQHYGDPRSIYAGGPGNQQRDVYQPIYSGAASTFMGPQSSDIYRGGGGPQSLGPYQQPYSGVQSMPQQQSDFFTGGPGIQGNSSGAYSGGTTPISQPIVQPTEQAGSNWLREIGVQSYGEYGGYEPNYQENKYIPNLNFDWRTHGEPDRVSFAERSPHLMRWQDTSGPMRESMFRERNLQQQYADNLNLSAGQRLGLMNKFEANYLDRNQALRGESAKELMAIQNANQEISNKADAENMASRNAGILTNLENVGKWRDLRNMTYNNNMNLTNSNFNNYNEIMNKNTDWRNMYDMEKSQRDWQWWNLRNSLLAQKGLYEKYDTPFERPTLKAPTSTSTGIGNVVTNNALVPGKKDGK